MPIPFSAQAVLNLPGGPNLPNDPVQAQVSQNFESQVELRLSLTGSGTKAVDVGSIGAPGAKMMFLMVEASTAGGSVVIRLNGEVTGGVQVSAGGFFMVASPTPTAGITEVDIVYTSSVTVRLWLLA